MGLLVMHRTRRASIAVLAAIILGCAQSRVPTPETSAPIDPPLVDHHQHFFSAPLATLVNPNPVPPGATIVEPIDADKLIALLDAAGIQRALVLALGYSWGNPSRNVEDEYERVKGENDWVAEQVARYPGRLRACGVRIGCRHWRQPPAARGVGRIPQVAAHCRRVPDDCLERRSIRAVNAAAVARVACVDATPLRR